jgi:tripartite-type tricarboxylate transporter receptor subunit TctC
VKRGLVRRYLVWRWCDVTENAILADPRLKARFADLGITPMPMTPSECRSFITAETEKWAKVIKFAGIKLE